MPRKPIIKSRRLLIIGLFAASLCNFSCKGNKQRFNYLDEKDSLKIKNKDCVPTVELLKKELMGKPLAGITKVCDNFLAKDTVIYEDDQVFWKGIAYYKGKFLAFLIETNWQDTIHVSRITIFDKEITTVAGIGVGCDLKKAKNNIIKQVSPNPDGYLSFYDSRDSSIVYYMNVDKYPDLANGKIEDADNMPLNIKISSILINRKWR